MDPGTIDAYNEASSRFATEWAEQPEPLDMYSELRRWFSEGPTVDVGCGSGRDVAWLRANGFDACGYDASEGLLREARVRCPEAQFRMAALPDLIGVPRSGYQNVLCETVIMHLEPVAIPRAVATLIELLVPSGTLWLSWRVTRELAVRDDHGRLYAAFDSGLVLDALDSRAHVLWDWQGLSGSSGKPVHRVVARRPG